MNKLILLTALFAGTLFGVDNPLAPSEKLMKLSEVERDALLQSRTIEREQLASYINTVIESENSLMEDREFCMHLAGTMRLESCIPTLLKYRWYASQKLEPKTSIDPIATYPAMRSLVGMGAICIVRMIDAIDGTETPPQLSVMAIILRKMDASIAILYLNQTLATKNKSGMSPAKGKSLESIRVQLVAIQKAIEDSKTSK